MTDLAVLALLLIGFVLAASAAAMLAGLWGGVLVVGIALVVVAFIAARVLGG